MKKASANSKHTQDAWYHTVLPSRYGPTILRGERRVVWVKKKEKREKRTYLCTTFMRPSPSILFRYYVVVPASTPLALLLARALRCSSTTTKVHEIVFFVFYSSADGDIESYDSYKPSLFLHCCNGNGWYWRISSDRSLYNEGQTHPSPSTPSS